MVRAEFHFLRHFILSPLPLITERSFFPPHPPYRSPKSGSRAFNGPWERVSVKLPQCGAQTRETHITYNNGVGYRTVHFLRDFCLQAKCHSQWSSRFTKAAWKISSVSIPSQKTRSQMPSFSPNPKPFEICACSVRKEVPRSLRWTKRTDAR